MPDPLKALLNHLDADPERTGERYEVLRRTVIRYLEQRDVPEAEELADEVLDRAGRRIEAGEAVREIGSYCFGVARNVYLEWLRSPRGRQVSLEDLKRYPHVEPPVDSAEDSSRLLCMKQCLHTVAAERRELVREYFRGAGAERIKRREAIAEQLGVNHAALYNRVSRLVDRLRQCKEDCLRQTAIR
jgi:RNA polymerase sigma factor (sigma-70 family)